MNELNTNHTLAKTTRPTPLEVQVDKTLSYDDPFRLLKVCYSTQMSGGVKYEFERDGRTDGYVLIFSTKHNGHLLPVSPIYPLCCQVCRHLSYTQTRNMCSQIHI